jgi:TRAP-type C4-dicarboxylate transport system substrate-binding protein
MYSGYYSGQLPITSVEECSFLIGLEDPGELKIMWNEWEGGALYDIVYEEYEKYGDIHPASRLFLPAGAIITSVEPIRSLEELKGKKMRAAGSMVNLAEHFGASAVFVPGPEVYSLIASGGVDGQIGWAHPPGTYAASLHEVTNYWIKNPRCAAKIIVMGLNVNGTAWKNLPDDLKGMWRVATDGLLWYFSSRFSPEEAMVWRAVEEYGVEIIEWPEEDGRRLAEGLFTVVSEQLATDPVSAEFLDITERFMQDRGHWE